MNQKLLKKVADRLGKSPQQVRQQASTRASRDAVVSDVALINMARDLGIGVANAVKKLNPEYQQQLSVSRVTPAARAPAPKARPARTSGTASARERGTPASKVRVFVSHSSDDKEVATCLVALLRATFSLPSTAIRATSVAGHTLRFGAEANEELLKEILACKLLIGLITPSSLKSPWVLLELGARWGTKKDLLPLTASGVKPGEFKGPIGGRHTGDCSIRTDVLQLISDVGTTLESDAEKPEVVDRYVDALVSASKKRRRR